MDIHRCRFVNYPSSAINSVAFTHSVLPAKASKNIQVRLAIGRANGDIEIWNPLNGAWLQELVIQGGQDRSVDGLVWVTDADEEMVDGKIIYGKSRLFSIGYTATITEWDLEKARAKKHASGQHGDLWCLGIQPLPHKASAASNTNRKLVAGTVDGNLVLYSIENNDLKFERSLIRTPSKNVKFVSIDFQSRYIVVVGCSNGRIYAYDIRNGSLLRQMSLGTDINGGSKNIIVWSVKCLPNGDIVSGDSTGQVCIWDGKTYTQAQRIQSHTQDVLCLSVSADGSRIVSGGMDRRTAIYEPMASHSGRWTKIFHRRYHSHDVKAMASFESKGMSVVVSGGSDSSPVVIPLRNAGREYHRTLSHLPQNATLQSAPKARLILSWWGKEVRIWNLPMSASQLINDPAAPSYMRKNRKLIAKIIVKGESSISSAAISEDGTLLAAATVSDIKVFQLNLAGDQIKKVSLETSGLGATKIQISPDKQWISWVEDGSRVMTSRVSVESSNNSENYVISKPTKLNRLRRHIPKHILLGGLGSYERNVTQIEFSPDSKVLAVADLAGYIDTWVLRVPGEEKQTNGASGETADDDESDSSSDEEEESAAEKSGPHWVRNPKAALLPKLSTAPVVLSFSPETLDEQDYSLLVITASKQLFVFNPLAGALSEWSRRNTYPKLPEQFRETRDLVKGVVWQRQRVWVYGASFVFMLDLSKDFDPEIDNAKSGKKQGIKRKRGVNESGAGGRIEKSSHALGPQKVRTTTTGEANEKVEWEEVDVMMADAKSATSGAEDEGDEDEEDEDGELQRLRGGEENGKEVAEVEKTETTAKWWHTYQYRPILGMVLLGVESPEEGELVEVALVERPLVGADLPERYLVEGEWERR
ncbi:quinon protein alcohol dehydrogenase-like superfamily [Podospora fimiseda]|uniref:Quinon protein alcohol dehydrogenase-like superfamily n=1 Tax=Podospora fimiseda TaxID=252190 RepID=A0AAN7BU72_9PEZI|nr:quinon protein alcohol dehydrogenase-like superfamily [Podospora fimiseda]